MLDVGFSEILLTSAIALIVLGPERLPKVARQVGNWVGRARVMARQLSEQLEREVNAEELLKTQSKSNSGSNTANAAPSAVSAPSAVDAPNAVNTPEPSIAPPTVTSLAEAPPTPPEPLYGLSAAATTAAAMHAADPKPERPAESPLPHD
ncbi:MAG TPA: Sec-independent protein translocase protein TatB [Steroidobacteraceae bacterium]|nr:Sec-independent protein translocase protein TatB [Steroidobacteraceae bacterium]